MKKRKVLITGITGQDGSYLAELLLEKGYQVYGMVRRSSTETFERIEHILKDVVLVQGDLLDQVSLINLIKTIRPVEVYNIAAQSFVPTSFEQPVLTGEFTALGVVRLLDAIRLVDSKIKFYQASSSEMFGLVPHTPQALNTPFHPRSPYGVAKLYGHWITINYRESYRMFAVSGVLFNHESPRRGLEFVSRKITNAVASIKLGLTKTLKLGNLEAKRDWGYAGDYVRVMWLMMQQKQPRDYVIGTGNSQSVKYFVQKAFRYVGLDWKKYVSIDPKLYRPAEVHTLCADIRQAKRELKWEPKVSLDQLIEMMVDADLERLSKKNP